MSRYRVNGTFTVRKQRGCLGTMFVWFFGFFAVCIVIAFAAQLLPILIVAGIVYLIYRAVRKEKQGREDYERRIDIDSVAYRYSGMTQGAQIKPSRYDAQEKQLYQIQKAEEEYKESGDLYEYIAFWENLWNNGGLLFEGVKWTFRLADLYIKAKQYDDALQFCEMIKHFNPDYQYKAEEYIEKIRRRDPPALEQETKPVHDEKRLDQIISECNTLIDSTRNLDTFIARYRTLKDTLIMNQTERARNTWEVAVSYYPDRLHNVIERAVADVYTLKTPRGQFNRFVKLIAILDTAEAYTGAIRDAIDYEQMRLREMRDECVLHGNAPDEPVSQDTTQDDHVDF